MCFSLSLHERKTQIRAGAVIMATGWKPYEAAKMDNLGFGKYPNVVTNVIMERLAAADGPTGGKIVRPSDGKEVHSLAFVQCAGSRDENYLPYCSGVCCLGSLKQATYLKEKNPEAKVFIFYIDIRAPGILEDFYRRVQGYKDLSLIKGKVARIEEDTQTGNLTVEADDIASGRKVKQTVEMVVLAAGIVPEPAAKQMPAVVSYDPYGFVAASGPGIYAAGCLKRPTDVSSAVQDATGAALKAIQSVIRGK
jgi:quinone-modifying oxidoreductase subunit QmoA